LNSVGAEAKFKAQDTVYARMYVYPVSQSSDLTFAWLKSVFSNEYIRLYRQNSTGYLCYFNLATFTSTCTTNVINASSWNKVEARVTKGNPGTLQVWLNGSQVINASPNMGTEQFSSLLLSTSTLTTGSYYIDDVAIDTASPGDTTSLNVGESLHVSGGATFGSQAVVQTASNMVGAFQVQGSGGEQVLSVDTNDFSYNNTLNGSSGAANFSFETGIQGWAYSGVGGNISISLAEKYVGNFSLAVNTAANANNGVKYVTGNTSPTKLNALSQYRLTWYAKLSSGTFTDMQAAYAVDGSTEGNCNSINTQTVTTTGWTRFECAILTGIGSPVSTAYVVIKQVTGTSRTIYIDGVQIEETAANTKAYQDGTVSLSGIINSPTTFRNQTNSSTAFQIQDTSSNTYLLVNTDAASISVGNTGIASTIQIGNTTGAVTQTINIGNNSTGSSTNNVTVGSTIGSSATTLQAGSGNLNLNSGTIATNQTSVDFLNTTATTINIGGAVGSGGINLAGGSGSTGCSLDGSVGAFTCSGNLLGSSLLSNNNFTTSTSALNSGNFRKTTTAGTGGFSANDVIILANDGGTTKGMTTTNARDPQVFGVAMAAATVGNTASVAYAGMAEVTANTGAVAIGDQLVTSTTAGQVMVDNSATTGVLGIALTSKSAGSSGLVSVLIRPVGGQYSPIFRNATNSTSAFQVQNAAGSNMLSIDTSTTPNLITSNPDFEATSVSSWVAKLGTETVARSTAQAYQGSASLSVTEPASSSANSGVKYSVSMSATTTYALSLYVRTQNTSINSFQIGRAENGSTDSSCSSGNTASYSGWTLLSCTFTTGDAAPSSSYIYLRDTTGNNSKVFYVDAVQLEVKTNLLTNPGVESAIGSEWVALTNTAVARSTTAGHFNSGVAGLDVTPSTTGTNRGAKAVVSLSSGTTYTFSVYGKDPAGTAAGMEIGRSEDGSTFSSCATSQTINTSFAQLSCTFTTGATSGSTFVYIRDANSRLNTAPFYIDSAQLFTTTNTLAGAFQNSTIALNGVINSPTSFRNQSDSTNAFQIQNAAGSLLFKADTLNNKVGVPQGRTFDLDVANTSGSNALIQYSSSGTMTLGNYGAGGTMMLQADSLVFQDTTGFNSNLTISNTGATLFKNRSDTTTAFQIQNSGATSTLFAVDTSGSIITVAGNTTTFAVLTVTNAHAKFTQTTAPTIGTPTNCGGGTGPTAAVTAASADNAGSFTITSGTTGSPTTCDTVLTFNKTFGAAPKAIMVKNTTAVGSATGIQDVYISASSATTFTVKFTAVNAANNIQYGYYYWVIE
jgi:hypothetical protein